MSGIPDMRSKLEGALAFFHHEATSGLVLVVAALLALLVSNSPLAWIYDGFLQENLHPWVAFAVLPLFAFANAVVSLEGVSLGRLLEPLPLGIATGLFIGKTIGIFGATWIAVIGGIAGKPEGATWLQIAGVAMVGGVDFTIS